MVPSEMFIFMYLGMVGAKYVAGDLALHKKRWGAVRAPFALCFLQISIYLSFVKPRPVNSSTASIANPMVKG